jgi:S-adenosylmethionine:tRNA ribosyltransferase-isomerase
LLYNLAMKTKELDYHLPKELIAAQPIVPRDASKLMVVGRANNKISHSVFLDLDKVLRSGDVLVFNKSKVFPARIYAKISQDKSVEVLFLKEVNSGIWEVMIGGRVANGDLLDFGNGFVGKIRKDKYSNLITTFNKEEVFDFLNKYGQVPLPPYIKRGAVKSDKNDYQNIFATDVGSAAAPTAGLHFTKRLIKKLEKKGVQIEYVTLHVGLGTFAPIKTEEIEGHDIHSEHYEIDKNTARRLSLAKSEGRRIIACGTTSLRVLESLVQGESISGGSGNTNIYIYPGYQFKFIDGLITNFHTPKSTLLALVYAFGGQDLIRVAYQEAIDKKYRFFSYGDGMIII